MQVKAGPTKPKSLCIFCSAPLDKNTKPEHILLDALGGRKTTRMVICSDCNNSFGSGIDKALSKQTEVIRNLLGLQSGSGSPPPGIYKVKAGEQILDFTGNGKIDLVKPPFSISENSDGSANVQIHARSLEEIDRVIPHIAAKLRLPEDHIRSQVYASTPSVTELRPNTTPFRLGFGGQDAFRSAAKSCLVLWATALSDAEAKSTPYDAVRYFILKGDDAFYKTRTCLDSRILNEAGNLEAGYGPLFNLVYVSSNSTGRVIGHFTLYNAIAFQIVLAETGGQPNQRVALVSNPLAPSIWSGTIANQMEIPFQWLEEPQNNQDVAYQRIAAIVEYYYKTGTSKEINRICTDVFRKHGLAEDQEIPPELTKQIYGEIGLRLGKHAKGLPYEEELTFEELRKLFT